MIKPRPRQYRSGRFVTVAVCTLVILGLGVLAVLTFGRVEGEELAVSRFDRRGFAFYRIPGVKLQVSPVKLTRVSNDLGKHLRTNALLGPSNSLPRRWDLVETYIAGQLYRRGEAAILAKYLDAEDSEGDLVWHEWTKKHPQIAKEMWPIVARLSGERLYSLIPDVIRAGQGSTDAAKFRSRAHSYLAATLTQYAHAEQLVGQNEIAAKYCSLALEYDPGNTALQQKANSLEKLLNPARAEAARPADEDDG